MSTKYRQKLFFADLQRELENGTANGAEAEKRPKKRPRKRQHKWKCNGHSPVIRPSLVR
jgi:hypothetical protein